MNKIKILVNLTRKLVNKFIPLILLQATVFSALNIFFALVQPFLLRAVFSSMESQNVSETVEVCVRFAGILVVAFLLSYLNNVILDANFFRAMHHIIGNAFMKWHETRGKYEEEGTIFQNITAGANALLGAPLTVLSLWASVGMLLFLLFYSWTVFKVLPFILIILFMLLVALNRYEYKMVKERENQEQKALGKAEEKANSLFREMNFMQQHEAFDEEMKEYEKVRQNVWRAMGHKINGHSTVELVSGLLIGLSFTALFLSVIWNMDEDIVTMANIAVAVSLLQSIAGNVAELLRNVEGVTMIFVPLERLSEILHDDTLHETLDYTKAPVSIFMDDDSQISIEKGEHIAIVGCNGSGKTTLISKISGIDYQVQGAQVEVYGNDPLTFSYENRRKCFSVALKEDLLFDMSAIGNVRMNIENEEIKRTDLMETELNMKDFMEKNALQLSGGQAKRVNLMRSCVHLSEITLADEPTAALDAENAKKAMKFLHKQTKGRTLFVVTHDPESLYDFDRIIYMEDLKPKFVGGLKEFQTSEFFGKWRMEV